ncbi:methylated-DNA--[protein]-cysteine S-methyltransferase [Salinicoccus roseus]|jgi:O-6-methylguanine DNA methyltransferase|uniref:methylated-DNA--[protein]-cysteine S-methyltransferase n=1 Tax=Salinicoccus roseus TaxID=45670 RepID=UPI000F4D62BC|nr:methylated-DNA--[protein]-cysteine S-methyltransferase [Salinicoccus roseus]RPE53873.1 methylated-DNA-[protein]-cysteine S-methyltransferase [Salinicoccus roseus]GGA70242.1 methylated-DNA--protein-cysteine methyltransferase [Salinicoccus roseus]
MKETYIMQTPIGCLKIVSDADTIIVLDHADEAAVVEGVDGPEEASGVIRQCVRELEEYFAGSRRDFEVPISLEHEGTAFQRKVWDRLRDIPYGETISYKTLAADCGGPNHSRAVANANGRNPISIIVPCHRVIASDGTLGGYTGGVGKKRLLLELEGLDIRPK